MAAVDDLDDLDERFPCKLVLTIPFPTHRLANAALRSLAVDEELSQLVKRDFALTNNDGDTSTSEGKGVEADTVLLVTYRATTHRMLRVAVNGFLESVRLVVQVMEEADEDVVLRPSRETLVGAQGVESVEV
ncbi:Pcc1-domain-containing protein [Trichodelitschia bisporula]|uniref:Pcc1-domain-containing protein n=1 Tax=Trichodelitschia bisporula TaxID=703511 RepID=A0A6G1HP70_9PEZI|nr:Pcc1-domain-containing protein [Trichodelitschia bisporula]